MRVRKRNTESRKRNISRVTCDALLRNSKADSRIRETIDMRTRVIGWLGLLAATLLASGRARAKKPT